MPNPLSCRGLRVLSTVLFVLSAPTALAQATRTWVSGVGDDANPCSRTAPCKTFAGAISKTATGGEINVLDPGGFGAVTITKSISIESEHLAGVLASGTHGIIVNSATATVVLRGLTIEGGGTGLAGIRVLDASAVHIEKCSINGFTQPGIDFQPGVDSVLPGLFVKDTVIRNNQGTASGGILVKPAVGATAEVAIDNVRIENNRFGVRAEAGAKVVIRDSSISGNTNAGILGTLGASVFVENSSSSLNGWGVKSNVAGTTMTISNVTVTGNATMGIDTTGGGTITTFGNNRVAGNVLDGDPTPPALATR